ncbi:MAG: hypothetical protein AB7I36_08120 [Rhodospirillaceae bacterium]
MLEKDLEVLRESVAATPLHGLEAAVWQRVAADEQVTRMRHLVLGCQAGVVAIAVVGGIALGGYRLDGASAMPGLDAFSLRTLPAPSTLLLGSSS